MISRFDTEDTIKRKKELAKIPNWRDNTRTTITDPDMIFKEIVAAKKGRINIDRTGNSSNVKTYPNRDSSVMTLDKDLRLHKQKEPQE